MLVANVSCHLSFWTIRFRNTDLFRTPVHVIQSICVKALLPSNLLCQVPINYDWSGLSLTNRGPYPLKNDAWMVQLQASIGFLAGCVGGSGILLVLLYALTELLRKEDTHSLCYFRVFRRDNSIKMAERFPFAELMDSDSEVHSQGSSSGPDSVDTEDDSCHLGEDFLLYL